MKLLKKLLQGVVRFIITLFIMKMIFSSFLAAQTADFTTHLRHSLPSTWEIETTSKFDSVVIKSSIMKLKGNLLSNDKRYVYGRCQISISILPLISLDSFNILKKYVLEQNQTFPSKERIVNPKSGSLILLPTHYDSTNSYRISTNRNRLPNTDVERKDYYIIINILNRLLTPYQ